VESKTTRCHFDASELVTFSSICRKY